MPNSLIQTQEVLDSMRQQEAALQQRLEETQNQLLMTRGAVQVLEHLITKLNEGEGESLPPVVEETVNHEQS